MNRTLAIILAALSLVACARDERARADRSGERPLPVTPPAAADAVSASPEHYRVLWQGPGVRALAATWLPGARDAPHSHPTTIWYALTDFRARLRGGLEERGLPRAIRTGDSGVQQPVLSHSVENAGDAAARLLLFELGTTDLGHRPAVGGEDAVAVANAIQLLEEHGGHRLIEVSLPPEGRLPAHSHPSSLWFALTDVEVRSIVPGLSGERLSLRRGGILRREAVRAHAVTNVGPRAARWLVFETH